MRVREIFPSLYFYMHLFKNRVEGYGYFLTARTLTKTPPFGINLRKKQKLKASKRKRGLYMLLTRDRAFYKNLFILALPIALQNLVTFAIGFADSVMISSLGDSSVSGVYMANQIQTLLQLSLGGIEGAILVLGAQYYGRGDTERVRKVAAIGMRLAFIFGIMLTFVCFFFPKGIISLFTDKLEIVDTGMVYLKTLCLSFPFFCITQSLIASLRSVESARVGLYVSVVSLIVNVFLNYLLIFGKWGFPELGVWGAAIATLVSRIAEAGLISAFFLIFDKKLSFKLSYLLALDKKLFSDFLKYGAPIFLGQLVWSCNVLAQSAIMGRQSAAGTVAALSVANTMHNLAYVVMNGMSNATGIITGKTVGQGEEEKMREYAKTVQILFLGLGLLTGTVIQLVKNPFISLYARLSPAAVRQARLLINVISVTIVGTCYQAACLFGLVKSGGDVSFVFKCDCFFVFLVVLPSALAATRLGAPPWLVYACLKSDQILKCFVAALKINKYRWMKNLTRSSASVVS